MITAKLIFYLSVLRLIRRAGSDMTAGELRGAFPRPVVSSQYFLHRRLIDTPMLLQRLSHNSGYVGETDSMVEEEFYGHLVGGAQHRRVSSP